MEPVAIRSVQAQDIATIHAINEDAIPAVNSMTQEAFTRLIFDFSDIVLVALKNNTPLGFAACLLEGQNYGSANYKWISEQYVTFVYVDRIIVTPQARNLGVGIQLYQKFFDHYSELRPVILAEVNLKPPNPASLRFHKLAGFRRIGSERWEEDGSRGVTYLERSLLKMAE